MAEMMVAKVWSSYGLPGSAMACSANCSPLQRFSVVSIETFTPNSEGVRATGPSLALPAFLSRKGPLGFFVGFANRSSLLADAFHLANIQGIDLATPLALPMLNNREPPSENCIQFLVTIDLAPDVADDTAKIGLPRA